MSVARLLTGQHVRLTAITDDDLPALARWYEDTAFLRLFDAEPASPKTPKQLAEIIAEEQKSQTGFVFAVRRLDDSALIGYVELDGIIWSQGTGWVSIGIGDPAHQGQGYGSEALRLLIDFAFSELNLRRVQLTVFSYNASAIHVYEKLGFRREGAFREFIQRDGQLHDMILYGLLRREWEGT